MAKTFKKVNPAEYVCHQFGSAGKLAKQLNIDRASVYRWKERVSDFGDVGNIPDQYHLKILDLAQSQDLKITPSEIIYGGKVLIKRD